MVGHAADVRTFRVRGPDGKTAFHHVKGRAFSTRLIGFGEACSFKLRSQERMDDGSKAHRWDEGVFLGVCKTSGQYKIFSKGQLRLARTLRRLPDCQKWSVEKLQGVTATPWQLHVPRDQEVIFRDKALADLETSTAEVLRQI